MRLAAWQGPSPAGDVGAAFAALDQALAAAAAAGADMAVMPELFLPGYAHEPMRADHDWPQRLSDAAAAHGVGLTIGLAEAEDGALRNIALAFGPDGTILSRYVKRMLFGPREKAHFKAGDAHLGFDFAGRRIGLLICYDVEFPECIRALQRDGCDLILAPTANPAPFDNIQRFVVPSQAAISGMAIAYVNFCGVEGDTTYTGRSLIAGPDGETIAAAGLHPTLLVADLPAPFAPGRIPLSTQIADLAGKG